MEHTNYMNKENPSSKAMWYYFEKEEGARAGVP